MIQIKCKKCEILKDEEKFSQYTTSSGKRLRKSTCNRCYNNKYNPWVKKPLGVNKYDCRFSWKKATLNEKIDHMTKIFNEHVIKSEGCWNWNGVIHHSGYPVLKWNKTMTGAHRVSSYIHGILEPNDKRLILHHCDNKICTNPKHLYVGSSQDNAMDRENRNRRQKLIGSAHPNSVLNEEKVKEIKKLLKNNISKSRLAENFKCSVGAIEAIAIGYTWKHVTIDDNPE